MYNLVSFAGIFLLMLFAWALSNNRKVVNWNLVGWGLAVQLVFALFIFVVPAGSAFFAMVNRLVVSALGAATAGSRFVFGPLALGPGEEGSLGFILAFQALPTIIFFASLMAVLYHIGVMPMLVKLFARLFTRLMRISGAESLCAASNIFVGVESSTTIKPYLERMTRSELHTVLAVGMGSIASSVLFLYVLVLQDRFPGIAGHLVSASFLSAPAALVMSKLLYPESGVPETLGLDVEPHDDRKSSVVEAAGTGANEGMKLVLGVTALLIAFIGMVALVNLVLAQAGGLSLEGILAYLFYPFALVIGVPPPDAMEVARLVGQRAVVTEFKSYQDLALLMEAGAFTDPRSAVLAAYALCGFAHVASLAIFVGGISALVPSRTADLSAVGPRALLAATLACLMTAAVAGTFFTGGAMLLGG